MSRDAPPPNDRQLESAVLSAWISNRDFRKAWEPEPELFFTREHSEIARVFADNAGARRFNEETTVGELTKRNALQACGGSEGVYAALSAPALVDPLRDVERLRELAALRRYRSDLQQALAAINEGAGLAQVQGKVRDADETSIKSVGVPLLDARALMDSVSKHLHSREPIHFMTAGIQRLDNVTGGIRRGQGWFIQAQTSWGKSSATVMILDENAKRGNRILVVTVEDPPDLYARRIACRRAGVSATRMRDRKLDYLELQKVNAEVAKIVAQGTMFLLDGRDLSIERICGMVRAAIAAHGIQLCVIDYIQAARSEKDHNTELKELNHCARLWLSTVKSRCASLMLSQVTTDGVTKPGLYAARGSKELVNAAEIVLTCYWEGDKRDRKRMIRVDKVKEANTGIDVEPEWDSLSASFRSDVQPELRLCGDEPDDFDQYDDYQD